MGAEHILVVDDEKNIRMTIVDALELEGYQVHAAASPAQALQLLEQTSCDLALIDLKMPGPMDGIGLLTEIHRQLPQMVVIVLTGFGTLNTAIAAMRAGAFDYLTKPVSISQILESVQRGLAKRHEDLRRQQIIAQLEETLHSLKLENPQPTTLIDERFARTSTLTIDRHKRLVVRGNDPLELTSTEFDILDYLARNADHVVTASELLKVTQGYDLMEADARPLVRVHIQRLRQKLGDNLDNPRFIANVRGKGYRFVG